MLTDNEAKPVERSDPNIINSEEVATFLSNHPDFFVGRDDLLINLTLPHQRGNTISLVERQMALLRDRIQGYRHHLDRLTDNARENEKNFDHLRRLVLSLLESRDLEQVVEVLRDGLVHDFSIETHALILFNGQSSGLPIRVEPADVAAAALGDSAANGDVIMGQASDEQRTFLFPDQSENVASVAIIPLHCPFHDPATMGVLALASKDPEQFQVGRGCVFVSYLGEILSRVIAQRVP